MLNGNSAEIPQLISVTHRLSGKYTDNIGHLWARTALMNCFQRDPELNATFREIADATGVRAAVQQVRKFRDILVAKLSLVSPEAVWDEENLRPTQTRGAKKLWTQFDAAVEDLEKLRTADSTRQVVGGALTRFLQSHLKESWRWLVDELEEDFWRRVHMYLQGCGFEVRRDLNTIEPEAPTLKHVFETRDGETVSEALERVAAEFDDVRAALEGPAPPKQRGRTPNRETVERNVPWFYRSTLGAESISSLAREYSRQHYGKDAKDRDDRSTIYDAISRARSWLSKAS